MSHTFQDWSVEDVMAQKNPFLLAADNNPDLLTLLRSRPDLASSQDEHGYSLLHAAVSYNHLDLLHTLVNEFKVDVNIKDEDGETALFFAETVEAAQTLHEELHIDTASKNSEGLTAEEKIRIDGEFPTVADYLFACRAHERAEVGSGSISTSMMHHPPPLPPNVSVHVETMDATSQAAEDSADIDLEFRGRIEKLAAREDFQDGEAQKELRDLIAEAVKGVGADADRDVRRRLE